MIDASDSDALVGVASDGVASAPDESDEAVAAANTGPSALVFRLFAALSMASVALSIDSILPAFGAIRQSLGLATDSSATAGLITTYFIGMAVGQIPFGLMSDRFGRRPMLWTGAVIFAAGALAMVVSTSLTAMLAARFVWGIGGAGLRVTATAMVRDRFSGVQMAREMAFVMTIFMLVPVLAPTVGSAILSLTSWHVVVVFSGSIGVIVGLLTFVMPETHPVQRRQPLQFGQLTFATRTIIANRSALAYTLALLPIFGVFSSYLASSERIFADVFDRKDQFPYLFGGTSVVMATGSLIAAKLVVRIGLSRMINGVLLTYTLLSAVALAIAVTGEGRPSFWPFWIVFAITLAFHNVIFPNVNSAAMMPVGHIAGTAAAIIGTVSTAIGALIGFAIDQALHDTVTPLIGSFVIAGVLSTALVFTASRHGPQGTIG
jgi:MFS transporter, DHA1 family, multidrug resistance protein